MDVAVKYEMRLTIFIIAAVICSTGILALPLLPKDSALGLFVGSLTLGGAFLICGLFSLKMPLHGFVGAAVIALLGAGRGVLNLPTIFENITSPNRPTLISYFEFISLLSCIICLIVSYHFWKKSKTLKLPT